MTVKLLEAKPAVPSLGKLRNDHGYSYEWTSGQLPHLIKMADGYSAARKTMYRSWSLVYRLALPARLHLQHRYHRILHCIQQQYEVSVRAVQYRERRPVARTNRNQKTHKTEDTDRVRGDPMAFCTLEPGIPPCTVLWSHAFLAHVIASLYLVLDHAQQSVAASVMGRKSLGPGDSACQIGVSITFL